MDSERNEYFESDKKINITENKNEEQIDISKQEAKDALEEFNLANKRYDEGKSDYIALQQARKNYNNAKIEYIKRLYEYNTSLADLEIAMHYHFDDLHAQAEHALHYHYKEIINKLEASMHCEHRAEEEAKDNKKDEL